MAGKKSSGKKPSSSGKARSALSGRYVSKDYAKKHPKTTVVEKNEKKSKVQIIIPINDRGTFFA